jgi:hypothetical protein
MNCLICKKQYKNYNSLWAHNKKFHTEINKLACIYCNKIFSALSNKCRHIKICKKNPINEKKEEIIINEQILLLKEKEIKINEQQIEKMKLKKEMMQLKVNKMHPKTFKKLNEMLKNQSINNSIVNSTVNSNNTIINNHIHLLQLNENQKFSEILTLDEKKSILNAKYDCLDKLIELTNCSDKYPQHNNIVITNLKDNFAYKYDDKEKCFITTSKDEVIEQLMEFRMNDIESIFEELTKSKNLKKSVKYTIEDFIETINESDEIYTKNNINYPNLKTYKTENIKMLIYNNTDNITKNLYLLYENKEENKEIKPEINHTL